MATGGEANEGDAASAETGGDAPGAGVGCTGAGGCVAGGVEGDVCAGGVEGAIGFWALLAGVATNAAAIAMIKINFETRRKIARQCKGDRQVEAFCEARNTAFFVACIGYISKKLRIIWCPPSVSTLSGWNCTPSTGKLR
jgi:hypothetical protein